MPYKHPKKSPLTPNLQAVVALLGGVLRRLSKFEPQDTQSDTDRRNDECDRRRKREKSTSTLNAKDAVK